MSDAMTDVTDERLARIANGFDDAGDLHAEAISMARELQRRRASDDAKRLDYLQDHLRETSFDISRECDEPWVVWRVQGGYNDREWHEVSRGETLRAAIDSSMGAEHG